MSKRSDYLCLLVALGLIAASSASLTLAQTNDDSAPVQESEESTDEPDEPADPADDIFLPSEEIQADSEISFPSDI